MFLYSCPHSTSEGRQVRGWIRVIWRLWGWWWRWIWESCPIWISSANQGMWWYRMLSFWCTIFSWSIQCLCLKLLQFFWGQFVTKRVFTWHWGDLSTSGSSLWFPLMALYLFTWYHHKMSCRHESLWREFTLVVLLEQELHSGTKFYNGIR